jgi:hypothetical protein
MDFRIEFNPPVLKEKIDITDKILLVGSCFTEHMHDFLHKSKFQVLQNPHGVLFNPISIFEAITTYIQNKQINESDLFMHLGLWKNWTFHSGFARTDKSITLNSLNASIQKGHTFLNNANFLFITLGSAFVYTLSNGKVVANCHKQPADTFSKRLLEPAEIIDSFSLMFNELKQVNPALRIIFTVSPVRHLKDGFIQNNRSKAVLMYAIDRITTLFPEIIYFPAYELVIDDLRDYRFFAEDMVHPNYQATRYVWEKFKQSSLNGRTREVLKDIDALNSATNHVIMHPGSEEHQKFVEKFKSLTESIVLRFPMLDFSNEVEYFK